MSEGNQHHRLKRLAKWFLIRLPFALAVAGLLMFFALKMAENYKEPLKEGLEQFLSENLQASATIGRLEQMTFVPDLQIDMQNLTIHERTNVALVDMSIEKARVSIPFSAMFFGASKINDLAIEKLVAKPGLLTPRALNIDEMGLVTLDGPEQYGAFLRVKGQYGGEKMLLDAQLEQDDDGSYIIRNTIPLSLKIGNQEVNAQLVKSFSKVLLKTLVYKKGDQQSAAQDYILEESGSYNYDNPLSCMLGFGNIEDCSVYLTTESNL